MSHSKALGAALVAIGLAVAPAAAQAQNHIGLTHSQLRGVPARVASKLNRVERALQRAENYADDGDAAHAATAMNSVARNLASALRATDSRIASSASTGPAAARAFAATADDVIETTSGDFDGETDGDLVTALASALGAGIDDRNTMIAAISALTDQSGYADVGAQIGDDASNESSDVSDSIANDTLTSDATAALNDAKTKLDAVAAAVAGFAGSSSSSGDTPTAGSNGDCPAGQSQSSTSSTSTAQSAQRSGPSQFGPRG